MIQYRHMESSEKLRRYFQEGKSLFLAEAEAIKSTDIRRFTLEALDAVDPRFWTIPSSSSGRYHPPEDQGEGGLVRHVIKAVTVAQQESRRFNLTKEEEDMAVAAALLHDTCKNGIPWGEATDFTHGLVAARWLEQFELDNQTIKQGIISAVRYHMAPWCYAINPYEDRPYTGHEMRQNLDELGRALTQPSRVEMVVRNADYWSSRRDISFLPGVSVYPQ